MNNLEIVLDFSKDVPIYEQIETQIRDAILSGRLAPGASIPSMRSLAKMLRVSVITVQKAYENLKKEGYIDSAVGRGTVVKAASHERELEARRKELEEHLQKAIRLAASLGMDGQDLKNLLDLLGEEADGRHDPDA